MFKMNNLSRMFIFAETGKCLRVRLNVSTVVYWKGDIDI